MSTGARQSEQERDGDDEQEAAVLGERRQVEDERAPPHADVVEGRGEHDGDGGDVVHPIGVRLDARIEAEDAQQILGEGGADRAERCGADEHELGPAKKKGRESAPALADEDVHPTRRGELPRQLGQGERAAESEQSARDPHRHEREWTGELVRDPGGRAKDSGADGGADQNGDGAPEAELALEGHAGMVRGGTGCGLGLNCNYE